MTPRVRFAPSPTGRIHIGNIRTAALNWLFARKNGGSFFLRLDDTDTVRSTEEFADAIRDDLKWLGLTWDEQARQQDRTVLYEDAADALKASGVLYPCFESEEELDRRRKRQLAMHKPPIYDRAALKLSDDEIATRIGRGEKPHWRFRLPNTSEERGLAPQPTLVSWNDLDPRRSDGRSRFALRSRADPRRRVAILYTFTSVVDDIAFAITHIVRGEDHVTNTGVQLAIFEAAGATPPAFGHHSLLDRRRRPGAVETIGRALHSELPRRRPGADGSALPRRTCRHVGCDRAVQDRATNSPPNSTSRRSRRRPDASTSRISRG